MIQKAIRDGFGEALAETGIKDQRIVVLSGDLEDSTKAINFKNAVPKRFYNLGIAEQDLVGTAAGMSREGFIPFVCSFAVFLTNRAYDQIRVTVCYNNFNVKLVASHGGVTVGSDGATAQCLEDFAIMRVLPNMKVICPCDAVEVKKAVKALIVDKGPSYMRTGRAPSNIITEENDPFIIGKANVMQEGKDAVIIACGIMVAEALSAAEILKKEGIEAAVLNMHTIKPLDEEAVVFWAKKTKAVVTAEEHQIIGGLGSAVSEVLSLEFPVPVEMIGVKDSFGESGEPGELMEKYGLKDKHIVLAVKNALKRKN
ncbi:MAG: transketolase [Candidatus Firestonebacteria bacterium RIFOXYC2_FULL_39_67]|nr:MAG: transketolase [Candidatus Firestonebacteria bacterium RIFOXYD2_FULL_39_29]OGF55412.1 MAG: transketolase [Candidatus Firestonebacteria bacterium RIFOXYC2_FULL_39_67]OGF57946.1 MAG: transketolase [Candidatus Firestonebacteria bacterium RifOxyC12_full_39_7]